MYNLWQEPVIFISCWNKYTATTVGVRHLYTVLIVSVLFSTWNCKNVITCPVKCLCIYKKCNIWLKHFINIQYAPQISEVYYGRDERIYDAHKHPIEQTRIRGKGKVSK